MKLYTIGFTQHSAREFFEKLRMNYVRTLIDIRISNNSQLSGFAKSTDLPYFLDLSGKIDYLHLPKLAPEKELLRKYRNKEIDWESFAFMYEEQIDKTNAIKELDPDTFNDACLLCSEFEPSQCHRRLLAQRLSENWNLDIIHL